MRILHAHFTLSCLLVLLGAGCEISGPAFPLGSGTRTPYLLEVPTGLPTPPSDVLGPLTVEKVELGRMLFYDPILSADSTISCSSCHEQEKAFTDGLAVSTGIGQQQGNISSMALFNLAYHEDFFWNGRAHGLEAQALEPVENPIEMGENWDRVIQKLKNSPDYTRRFQVAFGDPVINKFRVAHAIAQFEFTIFSGNTRFDLYRKLDPASAFTQAEREGFLVFTTENPGGGCFHCHEIILGTDHEFRNNGLDSVFGPENYGLYEVTGNPADIGKFKTPTLRNIALTAPYMHDGRFQTLEEVVEFYDQDIQNSPTLDIILDSHEERWNEDKTKYIIGLTDEDKANLIAFLKTLTDSTLLMNPAYSNPFE